MHAWITPGQEFRPNRRNRRNRQPNSLCAGGEGGVHAWINNAGYSGSFKNFMDHGEDQIEQASSLFSVNLFCVWSFVPTVSRFFNRT